MKELVEKHISDINVPYVPDFGQIEEVDFELENQSNSWRMV